MEEGAGEQLARWGLLILVLIAVALAVYYVATYFTSTG